MIKRLLLTSVLFACAAQNYAQCWQSISAKNGQSAAIKADGSLWTWGANLSGQLGHNASLYATTPGEVATEENLWSTIATGHSHMIAVKQDGTLWSWGSHAIGLGNGQPVTSSPVPIQIGTDVDWSQLTAGSIHSLAIRNDGTLWSWGSNVYGSLGDGTFVSKNYPVQIGTDNDWIFIDAGEYSSFAIKSNGTLWAWGANTDGRLGDGTTVTRNTPTQIGTDQWTMARAGHEHAVGIKQDGTLWAWGRNGEGHLWSGPTVRLSPLQVGTDSDWTKAGTYGSFCVAIKNNGSLWSWGFNAQGQLGVGSTDHHNSPTLVNDALQWNDIALSYTHAMALTDSGTLYVFGSNSLGRLGLGLGIDQYVTIPSELECPALNVIESVSSNPFYIYPNPVQDVVNISSVTDEPITRASVFDMSGKKVAETFNSTSVDVSQLQEGMYLLRIDTPRNTSTVKIVKN